MLGTYLTNEIFDEALFEEQPVLSDVQLIIALKYLNTGLVSSGVNLTSCGGASSALVAHPSSDGITIKILYGVDVLLHRPALYPIFSYWVG